MVYPSYFLKTLSLSAILSLIAFVKTSSGFNIAPSAPDSLFIGGSMALKFTNMDADWQDMDTKLAVLNSNNILEVVAVIASKSHVANNYADIISIPNNIPEGSNYYFISQVTGGSSYAESGPYNIPKSYSPFGSNLPSVTAAVVLETYTLDTPPPLAVAQTSASSSSTTNSVTPTPAPTVSDASSSDTKSSSTSVTPKSDETTSHSKSGTTSVENIGHQIFSLSKTIIIVIAVIIPVAIISIIAITVFCLVRRRRRRMGASSGTTLWETRTTALTTEDRTADNSGHYY